MKTQVLLTTRAPFEALFLLLLEDCMLLEGLFLLPLEGCMPAALFALHTVCVCVCCTNELVLAVAQGCCTNSCYTSQLFQPGASQGFA